MTYEAESRWANQYIGTTMRHQMSGQKGIVIAWNWGKNGHGAWFMTENGLKIYRRFPKNLA